MSNTEHAECRGGVPRTVSEFHIVWRVVTLHCIVWWSVTFWSRSRMTDMWVIVRVGLILAVLEIARLLWILQVSSTEAVSCPATVLVQLALEKWLECGVKADNISVVVVLFENCKYNCSIDDTQRHNSLSSISDTPIRNSVDFCSVKKQLYRRRHQRKSNARKPLASICNPQNKKCGSVKSQKHTFKIPTTPEQRSAYWSHRKHSKMIENLPLDFDSFANANATQTRCFGGVQIEKFCM